VIFSLTWCGFVAKISAIEPQDWLDGFTLRNLADLARFRGYIDKALAYAIEKQRKLHPRPRRIPGEALAMDVRNVVHRLADNPEFRSGNFSVERARNLGIRLTESSSGMVLTVRKVAEDGVVLNAGSDEVLLNEAFFQDSLIPGSSSPLPVGFSVMMVWAVGADDLLKDCRLIVYDTPAGALDLNWVTVRATKEVPPFEAITSGTLPQGVSVTPGDDFGDLVQRRGSDQAAQESGEMPGT
jgi:hypothetical protein